MAMLGTNTADKFIVDRRRPHRNSEVARAVRKTRDRLARRAGNPVFDRELLKLHARAMTHGAAAMVVLVLAITIGGLWFGLGKEIIPWSLISLAAYGGLAAVANRVHKKPTAQINPRGTVCVFLLMHFASGLGWAYFAALPCQACQPDPFAVAKALVLLVAIAAAAIIGSYLRHALIVGFAQAVLAYGLFSVRLDTPVDLLMLGLLVLALPFLSYLSGHLHKSTVMMMLFRIEMDGLVAELETAKTISDEARNRAEEANLAKSRFLASMSHELRTPLNAILGFSEVMAKEVLGPIANITYRDYARDIHGSGQHLLDLINEILDLSRIEAGRYHLKEEPVTLTHVVEDCCHMMELKARNKDLRVVQLFEPELPRLLADERAVRQITLNLLSNAVKFTPAGGQIRVAVGWTAGGGQYIAVRDNGPGIPSDEIAIVLAAFGQGSIAIKSAEQGTGLGLPIVQGLVELHGGRFELNSKLREGTNAIAAFPAWRVMEVLPAVAASAGSAG